MKIEELNIKKQAIEKKLMSVKNAIQKIEDDELLPGIKAKYEGKYFKYENRYDSHESWWMYFYVSKVTSIRRVEGIEFQQSITGEITVNKKTHMCISLLFMEIDKSEFDKNIKKTMSILNSYIL